MEATQTQRRKSAVELYGVDTIPEHERTGKPRDILNVLLGSNMSLGTIFFGWLPVAFGLGFWASITSMAVGTLVGVAIVAPLSTISMRTATNLSTSSGAAFGVRGRLIGSGIGLLLSLGYTALIVWTGGGIVVGLLERLLGLPSNGWTYTFVYVILTVLTVSVAIIGYRWVVKLNSWIIVGTLAMMALGLVAYAQTFTFNPIVSEYAAGGFWETWALSALIVGVGGPVSYITILGDYTRYMSPRVVRPRRVLVMTSIGLFFGLFIPQAFGTFTALAANATTDFVGPLVAAAPIWFLILLAFSGIFGTLGNSGMLVYDMGLDLDAILPQLSRISATVIVSVVAAVLVFMGHFVWDAEDAVSDFVLILTSLATPWAVITLIGHVKRRGVYDLDALQIYNRRSKGGPYWFHGGWSVTATIAWGLGAVVGMLALNATFYQGPLVGFMGGFDFGFLLAGAVSALAYLLLLRVWPLGVESLTVQGDRGRGRGRGVRVANIDG